MGSLLSKATPQAAYSCSGHRHGALVSARTSVRRVDRLTPALGTKDVGLPIAHPYHSFEVDKGLDERLPVGR